MTRTLVATPDPDDNDGAARAFETLTELMGTHASEEVRLAAATEVLNRIGLRVNRQVAASAASTARGISLSYDLTQEQRDSLDDLRQTQALKDAIQNLEPAPEAPETPRGSVLLEARGLITGDRNVSYGSPTQNFTNIAEMWTTRLRHKLLPGEEITASEVGELQILLKIARNVAQPKRDNFVDLAGYAACAFEAFADKEGLNE